MMSLTYDLDLLSGEGGWSISIFPFGGDDILDPHNECASRRCLSR